MQLEEGRRNSACLIRISFILLGLGAWLGLSLQCEQYLTFPNFDELKEKNNSYAHLLDKTDLAEQEVEILGTELKQTDYFLPKFILRREYTLHGRPSRQQQYLENKIKLH